VSWSASRRRAVAASRTGSALALATTGNAGERTAAASRSAANARAAGSISGEWNAPLTAAG